MQIKKSLLIRYCILFAIFLGVGITAGIIYNNHQKEKLAKEKFEEQFERAVAREYDSLIREYNSIVETIKDYDYSIGMRCKYVKKLNNLLGEIRYEYTDSDYSTVYNCRNKLDENRIEDYKLLEKKAIYNILNN